MNNTSPDSSKELDEVDQIFGTRGMSQDQMKSRVRQLIALAVQEARNDDTKRFTELVRIIKRYNLVGFVKLYNEAIKRDWQDIRVPIMRNAELYSGDELATLTNNKPNKEDVR